MAIQNFAAGLHAPVAEPLLSEFLNPPLMSYGTLVVQMQQTHKLNNHIYIHFLNQSTYSVHTFLCHAFCLLVRVTCSETDVVIALTV